MSPATDTEPGAEPEPDETEEVEVGAEPTEEFPSPPDRPTWLAIGVLALAILVPLAGMRNPWHLVLVDRWLNHPWFGGLVAIGAVAVLWARHVHHERVRGTGFAVLVAAFVVWPFIGLMLMVLDSGKQALYGTDDVVSEHNDVTAHERGALGVLTSDITLYADRGWASRKHLVRRLGFLRGGDSGPPDFHMEFTAADELTVHYENEVVYRVTFDPRTLAIRDEECHTMGDVGCSPRRTGFWGWLFGA